MIPVAPGEDFQFIWIASRAQATLSEGDEGKKRSMTISDACGGAGPVDMDLRGQWFDRATDKEQSVYGLVRLVQFSWCGR